MPSAFVTGGTGFIGSHLVEALLRRGYDVRCLIRSERRWLHGLPIREVRGDLFDDELVRDAVRGVDYVYHNAGVTRAEDWETFRRGNVDAATRVLEAVADANPDVSRVVVTSSLAAIGPCPDGIATEQSELRPVSRYGKSKALMENEIERFRESVPVTVIRPSSVYGPREADIYTFFRALSRGLCPVVGDVRKAVLSLVHVTDLVEGMIAAAETPAASGETYLLGSEAFYSWNDVKGAATTALGRRAVTVAVPPAFVGLLGAVVEGAGRLSGSYPALNREKAREIRYTCKMCSNEKAERHFDYRPQVPLDEGIRETIEWYREEGWL